VRWKTLILILPILISFSIYCTENERETTTELTPEPIAPENGSTITQNPPTFIWHSLNRGNILYVFEVSTDSQFTLGSTLISTITMPPDTSYTPSNPLVSGEYYWHVRAQENC
jgi:hypothetical protein